MNFQYRNQRGVSMIELMVALFIFSVGLLGFATLQTRSLQEGFDSGQRSVAIWNAQELSDRIRTNSDPLQLETYLDAVNNDAICDAVPVRCADFLGGGGPASAVACDATQMANFDAWDVICNGANATQAVLIDADVSLNCNDIDGGADAFDCSPGSDMSLDFCWTSRSASSDNQLDEVRNATVFDSCDDDGEDGDTNYLFEFYSLEFVP